MESARARGQGNLTVVTLLQHWREPVEHSLVTLVRASSALGAPATTATKAAMERTLAKRVNILLIEEVMCV